MPPVIDIMLLTDATGSMHTAIDDVKANMINVWHEAQAHTSYDIEVGVAWYRDVTERVPYGIAAPICREPDSEEKIERLHRAIDQLDASGGGDRPEAQLYALYHLAIDTRAVNWRPGARRYIAWFGDEPGHDPVDFPTGHPTTLSDTIGALLDRNVVVMAFSMNPSNRLNAPVNGHHQASEITRATTGVFCGGVDQEGVVQTIFDTIRAHVPEG